MGLSPGLTRFIITAPGKADPGVGLNRCQSIKFRRYLEPFKEIHSPHLRHFGSMEFRLVSYWGHVDASMRFFRF